MRAHITFDTLEYMDELKKSGMRQEEAEAITKATAKAFTQMMEAKELATKSDLNKLEIILKKDINDTKIELTKSINDTKIELTKSINDTKVELTKSLNDTKIEMLKFISENTWKTIGTIIAFQTLVLGLFGLMHFIHK